jgi:hypothetical protein
MYGAERSGRCGGGSHESGDARGAAEFSSGRNETRDRRAFEQQQERERGRRELMESLGEANAHAGNKTQRRRLIRRCGI